MENPNLPTCSPLSDQHCQLLNTALEACSLQDELLGKCHQAGLPNLDAYVRENNRSKAMAMGLKQAFFPDRP
jgi:hypothetical protein